MTKERREELRNMCHRAVDNGYFRPRYDAEVSIRAYTLIELLDELDKHEQ